MSRVLVTGASGAIGRLICPFLQVHGFKLRAFDRSPGTTVEDSVCGCLEDLTSLRMAARGMDAIIHLAACADEADFVSRLVPSNVIGLYNAFEAARLEGVPRFILASSCQTADLVGRRELITVHDRFPTDLYGLTKLWAEDMGRMYSYRYGLSVLAARLGWVVRSQAELDEMMSIPGGTALFLSHRDVKNFFLCALRADPVPFAIAYAFSKQQPEIFDVTVSQTLLRFTPSDTFPAELQLTQQPQTPLETQRNGRNDGNHDRRDDR